MRTASESSSLRFLEFVAQSNARNWTNVEDYKWSIYSSYGLRWY